LHTTIKDHTISSILSGGLSVDALEADRMGRELAAAWDAGDHSYATVERIFRSFYRWVDDSPQAPIAALARKLHLQLT
jgi:hypothetical protein